MLELAKSLLNDNASERPSAKQALDILVAEAFPPVRFSLIGSLGNSIPSNPGIEKQKTLGNKNERKSIIIIKNKIKVPAVPSLEDALLEKPLNKVESGTTMSTLQYCSFRLGTI